MFVNPNTITNVEDVDKLVLPRKGQSYREELKEMVEERLREQNRETEDSNTPGELPAEASGGNSANQSPITPEEETFKKRYGDLRRYNEKQRVDFQRQIDDLRNQLTQATREKGVQLPKTKGEVEAWMKSNPHVAAIVETIAIVKANEASNHTAKRFKQVEQELLEARMARAESELKRLHPDLDELRNDPALHDWAANQSSEIQAWLYDNPDRADLCGAALDLFKASRKTKSKFTKSQQERDLEASRQVRTPATNVEPNVQGSKKMIKESWINSLKSREYEKYEAEIDLAQIEGRIEYDVSGARR